MARPRHGDPDTGRIVLDALTKLKHQTGWTARTIRKFIDSEYGMRGRDMGRRVSSLLKKGVKLGLFEFNNGRYRLVQDDLARLVTSTGKARRAKRGRTLRPKPKSCARRSKTRRRVTRYRSRRR